VTALYGLPEHVEFCSRCVISNQRPNSTPEFLHSPDSKKSTIGFVDGVCDACRYAERKRAIDWEARDRMLRALCDKYRRSDGYDCIVPGSGGKDSFYAAHMLRHRYGMNPLTVTWAPHLYTECGWRNFQRWIGAGFDNVLVTPNARVHRLLTRLAVENLFHPFQPFMLGQKQLGPRMAALYDVPLVFYGENEAEYGNPLEDTLSPQRSAAYHALDDLSRVYLAGERVKDLMLRYDLSRADLNPYLPEKPDPRIEVHYLGYYLKWHPQSCYYYAVEHGGFEASPERTPGTYSKYNSIDDKIDDFHYYTTYVKFGIGRATYDAAQEIRSGDITRDEGVSLVRRFDGEWPARFADDVMDYLSVDGIPRMDETRFRELADRFRSPHLWDGQKLKNVVWGGR
jgi:N-acetyl sugar amidotransferase